MHQILAHQIDVVFQDGADGEDGSAVCDGANDKFPDLFLLCERRIHFDKVDFVLEDDDIFESHDFYGGEMFGGLRLGAGFVPGDKEEGAIHDGGAIEHRGHEDIVAGTIDEGNVTAKMVGDIGFGIGKGVGMGRTTGSVQGVGGSRNHFGSGFRFLRFFFPASFLGVRKSGRWGSLVNLGIGISQLDGDVSFQFVFKTYGLDSRDGFDYGGFPVGYVANGTDVDGGLTTDLRFVFPMIPRVIFRGKELKTDGSKIIAAKNMARSTIKTTRISIHKRPIPN